MLNDLGPFGPRSKDDDDDDNDDDDDVRLMF